MIHLRGSLLYWNSWKLVKIFKGIYLKSSWEMIIILGQLRHFLTDEYDRNDDRNDTSVIEIAGEV